MSFTYPLTPPAAFKSAVLNFQGQAVSASHASPDSLTEQVYARTGQRWVIDVQMPPMKRATAEEVISFLLKMNGREGTCYMGDLLNIAPRGTATSGAGGPRLNGAATARSNQIATTGWAVSQANLLRAGDWIQVGSGPSSRLHKVVTDAASDGSGSASLDIWPACRTAYATGSTIATASPRGVFRLAESASWEISTARMYGLNVSLVEVL